MEGDKNNNVYKFGEIEISVEYSEPADSDEYLNAILGEKNKTPYVFQVAFNGNDFYWEYNGDELTDEKFGEIMSKIIIGD